MKKYIASLTLSALFGSGLTSVQATSFILSDFSASLKTATSTTVSTLNEIKFGFFASGFTPTGVNFGSWSANFTGVSGYYDGSSPEWSAGINLGDNSLYPVNTQLAVIAYNILDNANVASATQAAIFTNPAWVISSASGSDPTQFYFDLTGKTSPTAVPGTTTALFGSIAGTNVQMAVIPEPSSLSLVGVGLLAFLARNRRKFLEIFLNAAILTAASSVCLFFTMAGHGQTTVSTPIVGFQKTSVPVGLTAAALPFLNPTLYSGSVTGVTGGIIGFGSDVSNIGGLLTSGEPYYIEVYSGALRGDRFDVDTAGTISAGNTTILLNTTSENNTLPVASIGADLNGAQIVVRKHFTLSQVQNLFSTTLVADANPSLADQINVFSSSGAFVAYYLRSSTDWRKSGDTTNYSKLPIPPGSGILLNKRGSPTEMIVTGGIRQNDFATPYKAGLQFFSPSAPVDRTPVQIGMIPGSNGWVGNINPALADQVSILENGAFVAYSLRPDGTIRKSGSSINFNATTLLTGSTAYLIKRQNPDANIVENQVVP
jgi:hypothetical protein